MIVMWLGIRLVIREKEWYVKRKESKEGGDREEERREEWGEERK